jgi:hypothetical protein
VTGRLPALLAGLVVIVAGVGLLDAIFTEEHDFAVLFAMVAAAGAVQVLVLVSRPPAVAVRRDVVRWLRERSRLTGEPVVHLADRAVTTYRAALQEDDTAVAGRAR